MCSRVFTVRSHFFYSLKPSALLTAATNECIKCTSEKYCTVQHLFRLLEVGFLCDFYILQGLIETLITEVNL